MNLSRTRKLILSSAGCLVAAVCVLANAYNPHFVRDVPRFGANPKPHLAAQAQTSSHPCVAPSDTHTSKEDLQAIRARVLRLSSRQQFAEALPELRHIASVDPGAPGLNLDISMSLLQLARLDEARTSLTAQIEISECLARLPPEDLSAYCKSEVLQEDTDRCRQELEDIRHSAQMGLGLTRKQMARTSLGDASSSSALTRKIESRTRSTSVQLASTKPAKAVHAPSRDESLALGAGTDAQLGAYSK